MAIRVFVTATNTGVGKTHTVLKLMEAAREAGLRPAAFKPIETGVERLPEDGSALLDAARRFNPDAADLTLEDIVPYRFRLPAAPFVARGDTPIEVDLLQTRLRRIEARCDILFIEGAGGPMVPIDEKLFMIDLPRIFSAECLLVSTGGLGSINDTLLCLEAMRSRRITPSLLINLTPESKGAFFRLTRPYYDRVGIRYATLPDDAEKVIRALVSGAPAR